ncbi:hypothetical protein D1007_61105 [Hordeum vulgare]|nr:hypothetical protein D1007_61105 [Hordeum vulgare]
MTTKHTWSPRFEPYFDQSQWPEYHGVQLWLDPEWKVVKREKRKTKRFRGDMDGWGHGGGREMRKNQFQEPTKRSHSGEYDGISTQQGNNVVGEEKDAASEDQGLRERAAKKLREEDAAEARKKKEEEYDARMKDELKIHLDHWIYEKRMKEQHKKMMEKHQKEFAASFNKMLAESATKREQEHQCFTERVMEEA